MRRILVPFLLLVALAALPAAPLAPLPCTESSKGGFSVATDLHRDGEPVAAAESLCIRPGAIGLEEVTAEPPVERHSGAVGMVWCERTSEAQDSCGYELPPEAPHFKPTRYRINWCAAGNCHGISGPTDGTIDLATDGNGQWCVAVEEGVYVTKCDSTWSLTDGIEVGTVFEYSHPIEGYYFGGAHN